jgi:TetR/AcrR family transcriptional repressor for divergent bdcA
MSTTNKSAARGRPRRFDPDEAVATAQRLFHERGYDAVSVADLTGALAAFGSKAALYARILDRYAVTGAVPLTRIFEPDRPLSESLTEVLVEAARHYAADATATGCMVLEGTRCDDLAARDLARGYHVAAQKLIRERIAERCPQEADRLADFVCTTMAGLSASARHGQSLDRLLATAQLAGSAIAAALPT